jgi:hypothetical protein
MKLAVSLHLHEIGNLVMAMQQAAGCCPARARSIDGVGRWNSSASSGRASADGTDQIQRNTIGEKVLRLPPEPRVDKGIPFRDIPAEFRFTGAEGHRMRDVKILVAELVGTMILILGRTGQRGSRGRQDS